MGDDHDIARGIPTQNQLEQMQGEVAADAIYAAN